MNECGSVLQCLWYDDHPPQDPLVLMHIYLICLTMLYDSLRPLYIIQRLRQQIMHSNIWTNGFTNCASMMWNRRNTMFAIILCFLK